MSNQNKVFDEKIKAYQEILKAMNHVYNIIDKNLHEGLAISKAKAKGWEDTDVMV